MQFEELPLPEQAKQRLITLYKSGKIPHAMLFTGQEGSGNLAASIAFAQYILCENPKENDSCGECSHCKKSATHSHPDIFYSFPFVKSKDKELSSAFMEEWRKLLDSTLFPTLRNWQEYLDAENKKFNIYASEIRDIAKRLSLKSYSGKTKILILWLPELLGKEGNMLLKLIEEPPDKTLFFLVTEDEKSILTTILSRTQRFFIPKPEQESIVEYLQKAIPGISGEQAESAALVSKGNMSTALHIVNEMQEPFFDIFRNWLLVCYKWDSMGVTTAIEEINKNGRESVINFLNYGMELVRSVFLQAQKTPNLKMPEKEKEFATKFAVLMEGRSYDSLYKLFNEAIYGVERNGNIKLVLSDLSIGIKNILTTK